MIRFQQVSLIRGIKPLLEHADLTINPGERVGLIGANGTGKSSLFAVLRQTLHADQGDVQIPPHWRIAHVAQETPALDRSALDYAIDGDTHLRTVEAELAALEAADAAGMAAQAPANVHATATAADAAHDDAAHRHGSRIAELHAALADADAYTVRSRAETLLAGLGFSLAQMGQPVASFSGGWRMRLNLAQALMCPSDLLLLDEPTNHLDLDAIIWLEDWLKRYPGTLIIISHDRDFLDGVANVIVQIDERKLKRYSGNYSSFERQRAAQLQLAQGMLEKQQRQRAHLQSFIDRFKAKATKARQAQSRMKALARMEELAPLRAAAEFSFTFREPLSAPNPLLVLDDVDAGYRSASGEDRVILRKVAFSLQNEQRIGLLGVNGAGKSTLIKTIAGEVPPLAGKVLLGKGLSIGYFAQHQLDMLRHDESPLWHLSRLAPTTREQELRNFLGSFNFPGDMVTSPIAPFSGGEKARLALALIVWQRPNLLLLDEPTNHLDLETREALTEALAQFEGTVMLVSHDRHLLRATTDQFLIVADGALKPFDGDLDDYRDWLFRNKAGKPEGAAAKPGSTDGQPARTAQAAESPPPTQTAVLSGGERREQKRLEAEARQRLASQRKPIETRIKRLEELMARHEKTKAEIEQRLTEADIYDAERKEELKKLLADQAWSVKELSELEAEWLMQQEALEALERA